MPTGRLNMRRIRDVLRLKFAQGLSERQVAASLGLGKSWIAWVAGAAAGVAVAAGPQAASSRPASTLTLINQVKFFF